MHIPAVEGVILRSEIFLEGSGGIIIIQGIVRCIRLEGIMVMVPYRLEEGDMPTRSRRDGGH